MTQSSTTQMGICNNPNCKYFQDGNCLLGKDLPDCEFFSSPSQYNAISQIIGDLQKLKDLGTRKEIPLETPSSGFEISASEAIEINGHSQPNVIVLAGRQDVGKTTLIATLATLFQKSSSFAEYRFCRSKTLLGFEQRCFLSRIDSGNVKEDTERTPYSTDGYKYLHLGVVEIQNRSSKIDLVIADIPGEEFKRIANSSEKAKNFHLSKRTDHFAFLANADLLSNEKERQNEKSFLKTLFQRFTDTGILDQRIKIQIVFTKWDLLLSKAHEDKHFKFVSSVEDEIRLAAKGFEDKVDFIKLASRSSTEAGLEAGWGFDKLLSLWVKKPLRTTSGLPKHPVFVPAYAREFCKYEFRQQ